MAIKFPKYILKVLNEGRLRIFENTSISDIKGFEKYTFWLFPEEAWVKASLGKDDKETISLAEKMVAFVKRNGGLAEIGDWDWVYFQPSCKRDERVSANKVYFLKIGITDPVCFEIESIYGTDHLLEKKGYSGNRKHFVHDKSNPDVTDCGWFLQKSSLKYCSVADDFEADKDRFVLYSRNDHDRYQWWTKWFDTEIANVDRDKISKIGDECTTITFDILKNFPNGVLDIEAFLCSEPLISHLSKSGEEGYLFYNGKEADYLIHLIARQGDYNVYVRAYLKG